MSAFTANVLDLLKPLLLNHGFRPSTATATATFCAFVMRASEDICYYLYVRDDRAGQGDVRVDLWVAPTDFPDDRLDALGVGYKVRVGATREPSDDFFRGIALRLGLLLPGLRGLTEAVSAEIPNPRLAGRRFSAYLLERRVWARVRASTASTVRGTREEVERAAARVALGQSALDALEASAQRLAEAVLREPALLDETDVRFIDGDEALLADVIASQAYVEALVSPARAGRSVQ